jgi:hypothetical protein
MTSLEPVCLAPEGPPDILNKKRDGNGCDVTRTGNDVSRAGTDVTRTATDVTRSGNDVVRTRNDVMRCDDPDIQRLQ